MTRRGWTALHAGTAEIDGRITLMFARSGGGKSTLAAALARAGMRVADEIVFTRTDIGGVVAQPLGLPLALTDETARGLRIRPNDDTPGLRRPWEKHFYVPSSGLPAPGRVGAAVFPLFGSEPDAPQASRLSPGEALVRIMESCLRHRAAGVDARDERRHAWKVACEIAERIPCYEIRVDALNRPEDAVAVVKQVTP